MVTRQVHERSPYDITLTAGGDSRGFMLAKDPGDNSLMYKSGLLQEILDGVRNDSFSYTHRDPRVDLVAGFEDFSLGAGFEDAAEEDGSDFAYRVPVAGFRGYNYTRGVDLSWGTRGYLANALRPAGLALDAAPKKIILSTLGLMAITTRFIYRWSGTAWVAVFDDGAGGNINDIFEFTNATATYLVAATSSAAYHYSTDGISWAASEALGSVPAFRASTSTSTGGATSLTVGEPAGATTNDILLLTVYTNGANTTITPNTGGVWNLLTTLGSGGTGTLVVGLDLPTTVDAHVISIDETHLRASTVYTVSRTSANHASITDGVNTGTVVTTGAIGSGTATITFTGGVATTISISGNSAKTFDDCLKDLDTKTLVIGAGTGLGQVYWTRRGASAPDYQMNFGASIKAVAVAEAYSGCKTTGSPIEGLTFPTNSGSSQTFTFTGTAQSLIVPANVTSMTFTLYGAGNSGANGGLAIGTLTTTPGETLQINVGGTNGYNGGTGGGAGASDVRQGGTALSNRVIVAGGAGGTSGVGHADSNAAGVPGGAGGASTGATGSTGSPDTGLGVGGTGGTGGTQLAGGTSGGALGIGGAGLSSDPVGGTGGGGGGGYYGGGGGGGGTTAIDGDNALHAASGGGGGGGSNYVGGVTSTTSTQGGGSATDGSIVVTWTSTTTAPVVPAVTTLGSNRMVIGVLSSASDVGDTTAPGGTTERIEVTGADGAIEMYEISAVSASVYGPYTATFTNSVGYSSVGFALLGVNTTGASGVTRWAARGQSSGAPVLWAIDVHGSIRNATLVNSPSNWSAADSLQMGQRNATQLGLDVINNVFYLIHRGGITSYDGTTVSTVFVSPFADPPANAARPVKGFDNLFYLTFGGALLRYDGVSNTLEKIWPRGPQDGNAELNGTITAIAASEKYVWYATKNSAGNTYIMQIDPSVTATVGTDTIFPAHTVAYRGANDVSAMAYLKAASNSLSATNPSLCITNGPYVGYYVLPRPGLRPQDDPNCRFEAELNSIAVGSYINFRAQSFEKWLTRGDIEAQSTTTETIDLQYQFPDGTGGDIVSANTVQNGRTSADIPALPEFTRVRYYQIWNTSGDTKTPILRGSVLHTAPNTPRDRGFTFTVELLDGQETRAVGQKSKYRASELDAWLFNAVPQVVTITDPHGNQYETKILDIQPVQTGFAPDGSIHALLTVTLGQLIS